MSIPLLIAIAFSLGFFIESIIGFGGGLIAYAILGFFIDVKHMVLAGLYIGTCSSAMIFLSDKKSFSRSILIKSLPICLLGTMIGVFVFSQISSKTMLIILGAVSIILSAKIIFFDKIEFPKIFNSALLLVGGVAQGLFGIGGPFVVNAIRKSFQNKSELRTTMAAFFVTFNLVRITQLSITKHLPIELFKEIWWVIIPIFFIIQIGFKIHVKIKEEFFKKLIAAMTLFSGIVFLFK